MARHRSDNNRVDCEVKFANVRNEDGRLQAGVEVSCTNCDHVERAFGEGPKSIRRCLAMMRENCPEDEENFYVVDDEYLEED